MSNINHLFAELLEYPAANMAQTANQLLEQLQVTHPKAAERLENFVSASRQHPLEQMQELYTTTFDMQPVCYPYVGFHLFGESYKRGAFMAQLNEAYHTCVYSAGQELPDHVAVILRFLGLDAARHRGDFCQALLHEGLMPALEKMLKVFGDGSENPYFCLLSALQLFLLPTPEKELHHA